MRLRDLFDICKQNLLRRKARTLLTMLGVMIGCTSIVIMVSIGVASSESLSQMINNMGDLTIIDVYAYSQTKMTDASVRDIEALPDVKAISVKENLNDGVTVYAGSDQRYRQEWTSVAGMNTAAMQDLGYELIEGEFPASSKDTINVVVGQYFAYAFQDTRRPQGRNMVDRYSAYDEKGNFDPSLLPDPYFNPMKTKLTLELQVDENKTITKELKVVGVLKEDYGKGYETSEGIFMDNKDIQALNKEAAQARGESISSKNKDKSYNQAVVKATDIKTVADVEKSIKDMGFDTNSMESMRQSMLNETRRQQMVFGGLGAISLFVAAIGIMNTMIMSISERTREIGVMKALGCYVRDIRLLFLMEAACIGLLGGFAGLIISFLISLAMNLVSTGGIGILLGIFSGAPLSSLGDLWTAMSTPGSRISVIPIWLAFTGLLISTAIGVVSGFYPANRAVQIPALEAIKHE